MYLFLATLGLQCFVQAFSVMEGGGYSSLQYAVFSWYGFACCRGWGADAQAEVIARGLLHGLGSCSHGLQRMGSVAVVHRLSCSAACGIFPDQGSNSCVPCIGRRIFNLLHHERSPHRGFNLHFPHG